MRHPTRNDRGVTLPELMVVMIIMGVLAAIIVSVMINTTHTTTSQTRNAGLWADMQDASTQLVRDVNDAQQITTAQPSALTVQIIRDSKCQERAWVVDIPNQRLTVTTTFYEQAQCTGPSTTSAKRVIGDNAVGSNATGKFPVKYLSTTTFTFYDTLSDTALPLPVETDRIKRVQWTLVAQADQGFRTQTLTSGAAFTGHGDQTPGGGPIVNASAPLLCLSLRAPLSPSCGAPVVAATGKVEGVDNPVLQWADASPTLTQGWSVFRIANPEGMGGTDPARATWEQVGYIVDPTQTWFVDTSLPAGYTAQYVVRATVPSGVGPTSNQVVTGKRPAATVVRANGATTTIAVDWDQAVGATGYDVFRDGILAKSVTAGTTLAWTDQPGESGWAGSGYGHTHFYKVVATNRWDNRLTSVTDLGRLSLGSNVATVYTGGARLVSAQAGDYTAPAAPGLTATPGDRVSNVSWTPPAWVGSGPTGQVTSWVVSYKSSTEAAAVITSPGVGTTAFTHGARPAGRYSVYQVYAVNSSGSGTPSGWSGAVWQRPATPSCTTSGVTTRSIVAGANALAATVDESYSNYNVRNASYGGGWVGNGTNFDPLYQSRTYTFGVQVAGNGGWSDQGSCTATTGTLATPGAPATPTCRYDLTTTNAPGGYVIHAVTNGVYPGGKTRTGLGVGSYQGSVYVKGTTNSDGYNTSPQGPNSGIGYCGVVTVVNPAPSFGSCVAGGAVANMAIASAPSYSVVALFWCGSQNIDYFDITWTAYDVLGSYVTSYSTEVHNGFYSGSGSAFSPSSYNTFTGKIDAESVKFTIQGVTAGGVAETSMLTRYATKS